MAYTPPEAGTSVQGAVSMLAALIDPENTKKAMLDLKKKSDELEKIQKEASDKLAESNARHAELDRKIDDIVKKQQKLDADLERQSSQSDALAKREADVKAAEDSVYDRDKQMHVNEVKYADWESQLMARAAKVEKAEIELVSAQDKLKNDRDAHEKNIADLRKFLK